MNVHNLELVRNNEIRNYVTHKQDVLSVYFFHNADICLFEKNYCIVELYIGTRQINRFYRVHEICDQLDLERF